MKQSNKKISQKEQVEYDYYCDQILTGKLSLPGSRKEDWEHQ